MIDNVFQENNVNVCRIESRKAKHSGGGGGGPADTECEIFVDVECDDQQMTQVCSVLKKRLAYQQSVVQESFDRTGMDELETPGQYNVFSFLFFDKFTLIVKFITHFTVSHYIAFCTILKMYKMQFNV